MVIVALGVAGLVVRYAWLPEYRPDAGRGGSFGVDVSHYQGSIDWTAVASDDIAFAYIKATEGGDWVDDHFATNWASARAAGLAVGAYHFFTLCRTGEDQAANFLRIVPSAEADLPPSVDLEFPNNCSDRPSPDVLHRELQVFLDRVEAATGQQVLLYVQDEFDDMYDIHATFDRPIWERSILRGPDRDDWVIWQFHYFADVDGIDGGVDLDVMVPGWPES